MSIAGFEVRQRAEEIRILRARIALGVKILTHAGYAMIGGTFFKELSEQRAVSSMSYLWAGAGVVALIFALVLAPSGGTDDG